MMKRVSLILLCGMMIAGSAFAGGSIFGHRKTVRNVNGVSSVVVVICRGLSCPEVVVKEGNCDEIEHATQQYGVCICDDGYKVKNGECILATQANCVGSGEKWCSGLNNCIPSNDCCSVLSVPDCKTCDSDTGNLTDKDEGLCTIAGTANAGYCFAGECLNPCEENTIDNCKICTPESGNAICAECDEGYHLSGNACVACSSGYYNENTHTCTDCLVNYGIDSVGACTTKAEPICSASGTCEACPADEPIYEAEACKCPTNATCQNFDWICDDGYYKSGNSCIPCPGEQTATCDHTGKPLSCKEGYFVENEQEQCKSCPTPPSTETICRGEPTKDIYNCATQVLEDCPSTAPICGTDNKTCKCPANADCTVSPWVCNAGYFKAEGTTGDDYFVCYPCTIKDSHAATCDDNGDPKTCESGYAPADGKCIQTCTSYTENECGPGYYCVFNNAECTGSGEGLCRPVSYMGEYKSATVNNRKYTMSHCQEQNCMNWWTANSWCRAFGKTMIYMSELGCSNTGCSGEWTLLRQQLGEAFYGQLRTWTRDNINACIAHSVRLGYDSANNIHDTNNPTVRSDVLCIGSIDS